MNLTQCLFAVGYDLLNWAVEDRLKTYRFQTAGNASGDVLEIGAGTGANLPFYKDDVNLTVLEPNPYMKKIFMGKAAKTGRIVNFVRQRGETMPFSDNSFDSVVTTLVLCMVDDMHRVVMEARRVLRAGGTMYFYEHVSSNNPRRRQWESKINPVWRFLTTGCNLNRDIESVIRNAGFREVHLTTFDLSVGLPFTLPNIVGYAKV